MGNAQSNNRLYTRLDVIVPTSETKKWEMFDKSTKPFSGHKDREQFICASGVSTKAISSPDVSAGAAITVITQNGTLLLGDHEIRLLYSRRGNDRIVARLVAEKDGVIKTKIEPSTDGRDQAEAFNALRRDVEIRLDRILTEVPGESAPPSKVETPSSPSSAQPPAPRRCGSGVARRPLAPPPEGADADRIMIHNEGPPAYGVAVKEWKTDEKK